MNAGGRLYYSAKIIIAPRRGGKQGGQARGPPPKPPQQAEGGRAEQGDDGPGPQLCRDMVPLRFIENGGTGTVSADLTHLTAPEGDRDQVADADRVPHILVDVAHRLGLPIGVPQGQEAARFRVVTPPVIVYHRILRLGGDNPGDAAAWRQGCINLGRVQAREAAGGTLVERRLLPVAPPGG